MLSRAWLSEHRSDVVLADVRRNTDLSAVDAFAVRGRSLASGGAVAAGDGPVLPLMPLMVRLAQ